MEVRKRGLGGGVSAIFPKIIMLYRTELMGDVGTPNHDIFKLGVECSRTRLYPDWLSLDNVEGNNLGEVYERSGKAVSPMGCRAYLSPFYHPEKQEEIYLGRNNVGAISLNLVKMAIESNRDISEFYRLIDKYSEVVWDIHNDYYEKAGKMKGSTNPLLFVEGGSWMSVGYNDPIAPILKASTASLGYIGLEEVCQYFFGESLTKHQDFALAIVQHLRDSCESAKSKYDHLFALYSSPAEGMCYSMMMKNRKQYGILNGVTDREYLTNSFHINVAEDVSVPEKILFESPFHRIATGGRISYTEFNYGVDANVLSQAIKFAMSQGLYYGVNIVSAVCATCNHQGDFIDSCPKCKSPDITSVSRVCGYLSYSKVKGESRYNPGKQAEIKDRVKHGLKINLNKHEKSEELNG